MLRALTRLPALLVLSVLVLLGAMSLMVRPAPEARATPPHAAYTDLRLYADVEAAVAGGEGYYSAATRIQRAHGFPTRPFVTVRLPTLTWAEAMLGLRAMQILLTALLVACALAWFATLRRWLSVPEAIGAGMLILVGGAMAAQPDFALKHEVWAGVLVSLAMALSAKGHFLTTMAIAAAALAIRELAMPFVLVLAGWAVYDRRWRQALAWAALLAAYAACLALHRAAIAAYALPTDLVSQGWSGRRGVGAPLLDVADVTLLHLLPMPVACLLVFLSFAGFLAAPAALARLALPYLLILAVLLALFARPVNFYWAILGLPTLLAGLALLPRLVADIAAALHRRA